LRACGSDEEGAVMKREMWCGACKSTSHNFSECNKPVKVKQKKTNIPRAARPVQWPTDDAVLAFGRFFGGMSLLARKIGVSRERVRQRIKEIKEAEEWATGFISWPEKDALKECEGKGRDTKIRALSRKLNLSYDEAFSRYKADMVNATSYTMGYTTPNGSTWPSDDELLELDDIRGAKTALARRLNLNRSSVTARIRRIKRIRSAERRA